MNVKTILNLEAAAAELRVMVAEGKAQAARTDADQICRLSDDAIAAYEKAANEIKTLTARFPDYTIAKVQARFDELMAKLPTVEWGTDAAKDLMEELGTCRQLLN